MVVIKQGGGYVVTLESWERDIAADLKKVKNFRYTGGAFVLPQSPELTESYFERLERKALKAFKESIRDAPQVLGDIKPLPDLEIQLPLRRPLYPYQAPGVAYTLAHRQGVIIGDQPGLGKTTIAAAALMAGRLDARYQMLPALIICPTTIRRKWQRELMEVTGYKALVLNDKFASKWPGYIRQGQIDAVIVNFESLKKFFVQFINRTEDPANPGQFLPFTLADIVFKPEVGLFKTVIIDEIHRCKDYKTQTSKFAKGITKDKPNVFGLTGTLLVNKPDDLIAQLSLINRLPQFKGLTKFKYRYCLKKKREDGSEYYPNLEELNYLLTERCFFRREKKDVLKDLPDKTRQLVQVDLTNREEYDKAEADFEKYLREYKLNTDAQIARKMRAQMLVQMGVLGEISARGKLQAVKEWGENLLDAGQKIVLFSELTELLDRGKELFKPLTRCLEISGRITGDDRDRAVQLFQTSPLHNYIGCNIKAGGVGIDLFASSDVGFWMLPWHNADLEQCEDRCHRNGQKNAVHSYLFIGVDTVDEIRWKKIQEKRELANTVHGAPDEMAEEVVDDLLNFFARRRGKGAQAIQLF